MKIAGLPEGVEAVRFGIATEDEFEITNDPTTTGPPIIQKGPRPGSMTQVIVQPADGWFFRPFKDFRTYETIWAPARKLAAPETTTITLVANDTFERERIKEAAEMARLIPGFVEPKVL